MRATLSIPFLVSIVSIINFAVSARLLLQQQQQQDDLDGASSFPEQIDPSAWAPFLPPPNFYASSTTSPQEPPETNSYSSPPSPPSSFDPVAAAESPPPFQKPAAVVLPSWLVGSPTASPPSPTTLAAATKPHPAAVEDHKINRGLLLTLILIPIVFGGSILFSTFVAWLCRRPPSLSPSSFSSTGFNSEKRSSSGGRGPFAPWLWARSVPYASKSLAASFEYPLLQAATNNFSSGNLLGEGESGRVYKARLDDDNVAAVKLLFSAGKQAERGFQAEVELLSKIRHPNLVSLLGYCSFEDHRLLVYEYMQNGSLQDQLHGPSRGSALTWYLRMKIALDAARGLEYLHEQCSPLVIHRDFKSSNVLVDASFNAKVADFGLSLIAPNSTRRDAPAEGTLGYVAPEYMLNGCRTEKSDVYAFGVVLLELISGRRPVDSSAPGGETLVTWALPRLADRELLPTVLDPMLRDTIDPKHLHQVAAVAALCVQMEPSYRPLIADVVSSLMPLVPLELGGTLRLADVVVPDSKSFAALQWNTSSEDEDYTEEDLDEELYY